MIQLLTSTANYVAVATGSLVSVVDKSSNTIYKASVPASILTVCLHLTGSTLWVGVADDEKRCSIFKLAASDSELGAAALVWTLPKKSTSCALATISDSVYFIGGDKVGEVRAFDVSTPTNTTPESSLLLGHTASIITSLSIHNNNIYTSDRDEVIRSSKFPETQLINNYFLGHTGGITSFATPAAGGSGKFFASGSADNSLRIWSPAGEAKGVYDVSTPPSHIAISPSSKTVVLTQDTELNVTVLTVDSEGGVTKRAEVAVLSQPVNCMFLSETEFVVACGGDIYIQSYTITSDGIEENPTEWVAKVRSTAKENGAKIVEKVVVDLEDQEQQGNVGNGNGNGNGIVNGGSSGGQLHKNNTKKPAADWNLKQNNKNKKRKRSHKKKEKGEAKDVSDKE